jgi:hypothetical protein
MPVEQSSEEGFANKCAEMAFAAFDADGALTALVFPGIVASNFSPLSLVPIIISEM